MTHFSLDPRLAGDTAFVADLPLCSLLLSHDGNYPWLVLVPRVAGAIEIVDLDTAQRAVLIEEIALVGAALRAVSGCEKLNVAALGNQVPQLHVHVIGRFRDDAAWPGPVWGAAPAIARAHEDREALVEALRAHLPAA